jgi:hypothetical protein
VNVQRLLQINMGLLAALGTVLLSIGQESALFPALAPALMLFAVVTSVYFTDTLNWFQLNRFLANAAALIAALFALSDFLGSDSGQQLLAIAHLLVYLQIVLLYQEKSDRVYGQLAVLSLLQVVVAAALNLGIEFGVLLVLYVAVALSALTLFYIHRELSRFDTPAKDSAQIPARRMKWRLSQRARGRVVLSAPPIAIYDVSSAGLAKGLLKWRLLRQVAAMGAVTVALTGVLFFSVPRSGESVWQGPQAGFRQVVGFSQQITLNEMGEVLQSNAPVMRVSFTDYLTREPYLVFGDPYFRGVVLSEYTQSDGAAAWQQSTAQLLPKGDSLKSPHTMEGLVCQDIVLEPITGMTLFSVYPSYTIGDRSSNNIRYLPDTWQLFRAGDEGPNPYVFRYSLVTTGFRSNGLTAAAPHRARRTSPANSDDPEYESALKFERELEKEKATLLRFDASRFPTLAKTAQQILDEQGLSDASRTLQVHALENHFRKPGLYTYTLDFTNVKRDRTLDPVEDFVANHRSGHCEYFASALALMLRSQHIPSRLVVGYKGGDFNSLGKYYQIRQHDAHAWVEAYLEPEDVTQELVGINQLSPAGAWLRLDPTPSSDAENASQERAGLLGQVNDILDYAQLLWRDYVLGLNDKRQEESIYKPLADRTTAALEVALAPSTWRKKIQDSLSSLGIKAPRWLGGTWFSWRAALAAMALCVVLVVMAKLLARLARRMFGWKRRSRTVTPVRAVHRIEFYERLVALLARHGLHRAAGQTQREFAGVAGGHLSDSPSARGVRGVPRQIVDAFYRVRFGNSTLDKQECEAIEHALGKLEETVVSGQ